MTLSRYLERVYQYLFGGHSITHAREATRKLISRQTQYYHDNYLKQHGGLFYTKPQLQKLRDERLRALLSHAKSNSPWYQKTLADVDVEHITEQQLNELPTINKSILMDNWNEIVTDRNLSLGLLEKHLQQKTDDIDALYLFDRYHVVTTGSTSGKRGVFVFDWDEWNTYYTCFTRHPFYNQDRSQLLFNPNQSLKMVYFFTKDTTFSAYAFIKSFQFKENIPFCFSMNEPLDRLCCDLNRIQPDVLLSMPSYIYKLCQEAFYGKLKIQPKIIFVGAETHYAQFQNFIKEVWPEAQVINTYSTTEGALGFSCRANHDEMHLNEDLCIIEPVDAHNKPVAKGVLSNKQYITNLYNYTLPLIRYESSDHLLFLDKTCDCGIHSQLIVSPGGRSEFDFTYSKNIHINHSLFVKLLLAERNIQEYQVIQTANGADVKIQSKGSVDKAALQEAISVQLCKAGLIEPRINIMEVTQFNYLLSGKLRRFLKMNEDYGAVHKKIGASTTQDLY